MRNYKVKRLFFALTCFMMYCTINGLPVETGINGQGESIFNAGNFTDVCPMNQTFGRNCSLPCHCSTECRTDGTCVIPGICHEGWSGPTCQRKLENSALNKATNTSHSSTKDPSNAVDGIWQTKNIAIVEGTRINGTVWWEVDLGQPTTILNLTVVFLDYDPATELKTHTKTMKRRRGVSLWVSNVTDPTEMAGVRCYQGNGEVPAILHLNNCLETGRYVRLYNVRNGTRDTVSSKFPYLEIREVMVFTDAGCSNGTYGELCDLECGHCSFIGCSRDDGHCSPCQSGWCGNTCSDGVFGQCTPENQYGKDCKLVCHCAGNQTCTPDGICSSCDANWTGPTCQVKLENIAIGKTATQEPKTKENASLAVDGQESTYSWVQREASGVAWWRVDLGDVYQISVINIVFYNPDPSVSSRDQVLKRRPGFSVFVSNNTDPNLKEGHLCYQDKSTDTNVDDVMTLTSCNVKGQYVTLYNERTGNDPDSWTKWPNLELTEVKVKVDQGCSNGTYGSECELECDCQGKQCDRETGTCPGSCINCREGCNTDTTMCSTCDDGFHGDYCNLTCPQNCEPKKCGKTAGKCTSLCKSGFFGEYCDIPCPENCDSSGCQLSSGECVLSCTSGYYSNYCNKSCPLNCDGDECSKNDGACSSCISGFYGDICNKPCSTNCEGDKCNKADGTCSPCKSSFYGDKCDESCIYCLNSECESNGNCKNGCNDSSFYGDKCDKQCKDDINQCLTCSETNSNLKCLTCAVGYYGDDCDMCPSNCLSCSNTTSCTECKQNYFGNTCEDKCNITSCKQCDVTDECQVCDNGLFGKQCLQKCETCVTCQARSDNESLYECLTCASGKFVSNGACESCSDNCMQTSTLTDWCSNNGTCLNGCQDKYMGADCSVRCPNNCLTCDQYTSKCHKCVNGQYGDACEKECGSCLYGECNIDNGTCPSDCQRGFHGESCNMSCSKGCHPPGCDKASGYCENCVDGKRGEYCNNTCSLNCENKCQRTGTGACITCKLGYYGEYCGQYCPDNCLKEIRGMAICDKADGKCSSCESGYLGSKCELKCSSTCGKDKTDGKVRCDRDTGKCLHGCAPGWYNSTCYVPCRGHCKDNNCHQDRPECYYGCKEGYKGATCTEKIESGNSVAIIICIVLAVIVLLALVVLIICCKKRRGSQRNKANGYRGIELANRTNGVPSVGEPLLHSSTNGNHSAFVNRLPVPVRTNSKPATEDDVVEDDDNIPLMSHSDPSDYYNLSSLIPVASFAEYVHKRKSEDTFWYKTDFEKLPRGLLKSCHISNIPSNRGKCRYKQLYPYDDTRVKLEPDGDLKSDFINASYVGGYKQPEAFIAAQGPTDVNLNDFWRMIWQKDCGRVVMLTNLFEECKMKCVRYWPEPGETETYGYYEVTMETENVYPDYTVRDLQATHIKTKEVKDFKHYHFTAWPDRGCPDNPGCMLHFKEKVMAEDALIPTGPILVHCSAGIGRTGTFIALDYLMNQAHAESHIDVFRTITDMRYQRTNIVQTDIQYEFLHYAIAEALTTSDMEVSASNFCQHYWDLLETVSPATVKTRLEEQFEIVNQMSPVLDETCFTAGHKEENIHKNRYPDIVPVDTYRAYLSTPVKGSNEYVNAVFLPACSSKTAYLLTQMPLPHTVTDFWRLVYDQRVTNIVMMNNVTDENDETIGEYWPSDDSTFGPFKVQLLSCQNHDSYSIMAIQLTHSSLSKQTTMGVKLFRFECWADGEKLPSSTTALTTLIGAVSRSSKENMDEPTIVHCMDGAERSGLYSVVGAILERLQSDQKVNIPQTILQLRGRRPQLIPTLEQYDFCHRAVTEYMESTQIYSNVI